MKKVLSIFVIAAVVIAMLAVPSFAAELTDVDDYGSLGAEIVAGSFDGVNFDGAPVTWDGQPINWSTMENYMNGFQWIDEYSPVDIYAADCPDELMLTGWFGIDQAITAYGYKLGDNEPVLSESFVVTTEQGVIDAGGQYAKRYNVPINPKTLDITGTVPVSLCVQLADGTVLVFNSEVSPYMNITFELKGKASTDDQQSGSDTPDTQDSPATGDVSVAIFVVAACAIALVVLKKKVF